MKAIRLSLFVLPILFACGRPPAKVITTLAGPTPTPNPTPVTSPLPSPTPIASPTPTPVNNGLKWTDAQLTNEVSRCKNSGDTTYTSEQWGKLCSCVYQYAAKTWDYSTYKANAVTYIQNMGDDGTLEACMREADML